jgi:type II secretory pathway pseudopilin PulG
MRLRAAMDDPSPRSPKATQAVASETQTLVSTGVSKQKWLKMPVSRGVSPTKRGRPPGSAFAQKERGVVLVLIVLTMLAIAGTFLLTSVVNSGGRSQRLQLNVTSASQVLVAARQALIGYAVGALNSTNARPGWLPLPDTLADDPVSVPPDPSYKGIAAESSCLDGSAANGMPALGTQVANLRCLGRLPWQTLGLAIGGVDERDALGLMPWYAVSPNLADPAPGSPCMALLNPITAATTPTAFIGPCPISTGAAWPWLRVCDGSGRLISDRVAFVLIIPGEAIATTGRTQQRSIAVSGMNPSGIGNPSDFLDAIPTPAGWAALPLANRCATFDNAGLTGEFIAAEHSAVFNDQVIFVTVDELMQEVEKRVAAQVRESILAFRTETNGYPWLAPLGNPTAVATSTRAVPGVLSGLVPFAIAPTTPPTTGQKFLTELDWVITTTGGADTIPAPATSSPTFFCYAGTFQCRFQAVGGGAVPRTITAAQLNALKSSSVATPAISCSYTFDTAAKTANCDAYSFPLQTNVTYRVERRSCLIPYLLCLGGYAFLGDYAGVQTRTVTVAFDVTHAPALPAPTITPATATTTAKRTLTSGASTALNGLLDTADRWAPLPGLVGSPPFDVSAGPFLPWTAVTAGTGTVALTIRAQPQLPAWYLTQNWYEFIYAAISSDSSPTSSPPPGTSVACTANCFSAGPKTGLDFVVISAGVQLAGQDRYVATPGATAFLEGVNSTGSTTRAFESISTTRTNTYADSVVTFPR